MKTRLSVLTDTAFMSNQNQAFLVAALEFVFIPATWHPLKARHPIISLLLYLLFIEPCETDMLLFHIIAVIEYAP
jgi:hypothetical protein